MTLAVVLLTVILFIDYFNKKGIELSGKIIIPILLSILLFVSCDSFIKKDDVSNLKEFEKDTYTLKVDIGEGVHLIKKGDKVKLQILTNEDFIKVYCYPANQDFLKAERSLLIYLFKDDFEAKSFNMEMFKDKLFNKVQVFLN